MRVNLFRVTITGLIVLSAAFIGCSSSSSTSPTVADFSGVWSGEGVDNWGAKGAVSFNIAVNGGSVTGTMTLTGPGLAITGSMIGSASDSTLDARVDFDDGSCIEKSVVSAQLTSPAKMEGRTTFTSTCDGKRVGDYADFTVTKP